MNRRRLLALAGSVVSGGAVGYGVRRPVADLEVAFWVSERAGSYDGVVDRVAETLEVALDLDHWSVDVSFRGVVDVPTEDAYDVTARGAWPWAVAEGALAGDPVDPASDVNLLVTDGQVSASPTGAGLPHVASVGGARHLAELSVAPDAYDALPYETPVRVMQVAIHECGHALGLHHGHGEIHRRDGVTIATPMVGAYAWSRDYEHRSRCGAGGPVESGGERRLSFRFSRCARSRLRTYRGGLLP